VGIWRGRGCRRADGGCSCGVLCGQLLLLLHEVVWHDLQDQA
jgi:hypothetical protein